MATFAELVDDVIILTNRPDRISETKLAVKAATLKLHQSDFFFRDVEEVGISFSSPSYTQQLEYRTLLPTYRALKYIRKADAAGTVGPFLQVLTPAEVLDVYGIERQDVCYAAGELIQIKSSTELQYIIFGYYKNPVLTEASFDSWIALDHPYAIVYEAAAVVFKTIGYDEQNAAYARMAAEQLAMIRTSNIQAEGY